MKKLTPNYRNTLLAFAGLLLTVSSCKKNLPDNRDTLSDDSRFTQTVYKPTLGRSTLFDNNFNAGNSTLPLTFEIVNLHRTTTNAPAPELTNSFPVKVWTQGYTGTETTLAEIENKRSIVKQPLFSIRDHAGEFLMWAGAQSSFVLCQPDSGYTFDVKISNSGGSRFIRNMRLQPQRERAFEPSVYDPVNGIAQNTFVNPQLISNFRGKQTGLSIPLSTVHIFFYKDTTSATQGNSLTFKFYDANYNPIDPNNFNKTNWPALVHGFDMEKTDQYVKYKVAYPIPLIAMKTGYTNSSGTMAHTVFSYDRLNAGGLRETSQMAFDFAIYEEGSWQIIIVFSGESPLF
jgi:hypothetical protein